MIERCSCGHLPTEHLIAADRNGPVVHECEASISSGGTCGCGGYSPGRPSDLEVYEELPWRAA